MHGLYVHFPFCRSKCDYCGFFSLPVHKTGREAVGAYIVSLKRELETRLNAGDDFIFDTVYFGGGTPSLMDPSEISDLLRFISRKAEISGHCEITMEINPADAHADRIRGYRDAGINRLVLGVQTLNPGLHTVLGRSSAPCTVRDLDEFFRVNGISHCLDLIIGIPGQTGQELDEDVGIVTGYMPDHISAYILSIEEGTPLHARIKKDPSLEEDQRNLFYRNSDLLEEKGYIHYEISNFALPGRESRHNMKYWSFMPYIGIGAGAHSFSGGERFFNRMSLEDYISSPESCLQHDARTGESAIMEFLMTGLRLIRGINLDDMGERFHMALPDNFYREVKALSARGLLILEKGEKGDNIRISKDGLILADSVIFGLVDSIT